MEYLPLILSVVLVQFLAVVSPGPDLIMVVRNTLTHSRRAGIWTAVGLGMGMLVHISYCAAGLALVIAQSIILFSIIKLLGAGYLVYIGIRSLCARGQEIRIDREKPLPDISPFRALRTGFLTNILNPKVTIFFLSLFTLVLSPMTPLPVLAVTSAMMVVDTVLWFSLVAIFFTQPRVQQVFSRFQTHIHRAFGGLLVLIGIRVAFIER